MRSRASWIALIVLAAALAGGLFRLLQMRFESGSIYPPYSSLRADPLGCRVLFESLAEMPGLVVSRHHDEFDQIGPQPPPALVLAGSDVHGIDIGGRRNSAALRAMLAGGARLIVALEPQGASWFTNRVSSSISDDDDEDRPGDKTDSATNKTSACSSTNCASCGRDGSRFLKSWGFNIAVDYSRELDEREPVASRTTNAPAWLPREIPCHTHAWFTNAAAWRVCYEREGRPVAIEREMSGGSMVVLADAYMLSNEAMLNDRRPALLAWLVGDRTRVIFDESHHGIEWETGFGDLARKYGLVGFLVGLLLLAALYVWMSSVPLLPREIGGNIAAEARVAGRDSAAGLINLLRRNIPQKTLLNECVIAWETGRPDSIPPARLAEMRRILAGEADPVAAYRAIARALSARSLQRLENPAAKTSNDCKPRNGDIPVDGEHEGKEQGK